MATQTVAAVGGSWSAAATWAPGSIPADGDDVVLNATSGQLTIDVNTNVIRSIVCTGYTNTLTHNAGVTLNIGGASAPVGNVALLFVGTETYTLGNATTSAILIADTSGATNTYNFAGVTTGNITINNGTTTTSQLVTSGFNTGATATVTHSRGGFDTNGQTCSWGKFSSSSNNTRTLTLGASNITIAGTVASSWDFTTTTGLTFAAGTSTITFTGASGQLTSGSGQTFNNVVFNASGGGVTSGGTYANITVNGTAVKTFTWSLGVSTVTGIFTVLGNSVINRVLIQSQGGIGSSRTMTAANVSFTNVDFQDVIGAGAASWNLSGIVGNSGDCQGNSGIIFTAPITQTATGTASFTWSTHGWTTRVPLPQDNVVVGNAFRANQVVTIDMPRLGANIDFSGSTGAPNLSHIAGTASIFGNLTFASNNKTSGGQVVMAFNGRGNQTITTNGVLVRVNWTVNCASGTYTLQDNLTIQPTMALSLNSGTLTTNNMAVTTGFLQANVGTIARTFNLGSSVITLTGAASSGSNGAVLAMNAPTNLTVNAGTSTIIIADTGGTAKLLSGTSVPTLTLYNLQINAGGTGDVTFNGNFIWNNVTITGPKTIKFVNGNTNTINFLNWNGSSGNLVTVRSTVNGYPAKLNVLQGYTASFIDLQDSNASGSLILP